MTEYSAAPELPSELIASLSELALPPVIETNWCVLAGGPCSGKSSIRELLTQQGYTTFPETAEVLIEEGLALGLTPEEVRVDLLSFQDHIMACDLLIALNHPPELLTFFDTSIIDDLVYRDVYSSTSYSPEALEIASRVRYKTICLLEQLPHEMNGVRVEDEELAARINTYMQERYRAAGYDIVHIPVDTPERRVEMILESAS